MDKYFILISLKPPNQKTQQLIYEIQEKCSPSNLVELPVHLKHLQSLTWKFCHVFPNCCPSWQDLEKQAILEKDTCASDRHEREFDDKSLAQRSKVIAKHLDNLADALPVTGSFLLEVIWLWDFPCTLLSLGQNLKLYGSLKRLERWHNASILMIVPKSEKENEGVRKWGASLNGYVTTPKNWLKRIKPSSVWHGNIVVAGASKSVLEGVTLTYKNLQAVGCVDKNTSINESKSTCLSVQMEMINTCNLNTIPAYLLGNEQFSVKLRNCKNKREDSNRWLDAIKEAEIGIFVRLYYATDDSISCAVSEFSTKTADWHEEILRGNFNSKFPPMMKVPQQMLFLMTASCSSSKKLKLYLLHGPQDFNGHVAHKMSTLSNPSPVKKGSPKNDAKELLQRLRFYKKQTFQEIVSLVSKTQQKALNFWMESEEQKQSAPHPHLTEMLASSIVSRLFSMLSSTAPKCVDLDILSDPKGETKQYDVSDLKQCPEWTALLRRTASSLNDPNSGSPTLPENSRGLLKNFANPLDCKSMMDFFVATGKRKRPAREKIVHGAHKGVEHNPLYPNISEDDLKYIYWPDLKHCHYPDIHYNRDETSEKFEWECVKLKETHVMQETRSTFLNVSSLAVDSSNSAAERNEALGCNAHDRPPANVGAAAPLRRSPRKQKSETKVSEDSQPVLRRSPRKAARAERPLSLNKPSSETVKAWNPNKMLPVLRRSPRKHPANAVAKPDRTGLPSLKRPLESPRKRTASPRKRLRFSPRKRPALSPRKRPAKDSPKEKAVPHRSQSSSRTPDSVLPTAQAADGKQNVGKKEVELSQRQGANGRKESSQTQRGTEMSNLHRRKLRAAVVTALEEHGICMDHELYQVCGRRLLSICNAFVKDMIGHGKTSERMRNVAQAHVKQVISFENSMRNVTHSAEKVKS